jgi:hypothetical protein
MMTGFMAAWNIMGGRFDQWRVNADAIYVEEGAGEAEPRMVPLRVTPPLSSYLSQ